MFGNALPKEEVENNSRPFLEIEETEEDQVCFNSTKPLLLN